MNENGRLEGHECGGTKGSVGSREERVEGNTRHSGNEIGLPKRGNKGGNLMAQLDEGCFRSSATAQESRQTTHLQPPIR